MTVSWTDDLVESVAGPARGGDWLRVERRKGGGWLLLSPDGPGDWYEVAEGHGRPVPLSPLDDRLLPGLGAAVEQQRRAGVRHRLLAWRVGRRAVLESRDAERCWITKVYRKDRDLLQRWTLLATNPGERWRTPAVLGYDRATRTIRLERVTGRSLNRRWLANDARPEDGDRIADLLRWLGRTRLPRRFPRYDVEDEIRLLESRLESYRAVLRSPSPEAARLVARVTTALCAVPDRPRRFCHRDLHDKQILLDGVSGSLIDLDLAAAGPPGLDAGNILAHLHLRVLKGARLPWRAIAARIAGGIGRADAPAGSLRVWTASALLRLSLIYARRRRAPGLLERLLRSAEDALHGGGAWDGLLSPPSPSRDRAGISDLSAGSCGP